MYCHFAARCKVLIYGRFVVAQWLAPSLHSEDVLGSNTAPLWPWPAVREHRKCMDGVNCCKYISVSPASYINYYWKISSFIANWVCVVYFKLNAQHTFLLIMISRDIETSPFFDFSVHKHRISASLKHCVFVQLQCYHKFKCANRHQKAWGFIRVVHKNALKEFIITRISKCLLSRQLVALVTGTLKLLSPCFHHLSVSSETPTLIPPTSMALSEYASSEVCSVSLSLSVSAFLSYPLGLTDSLDLRCHWHGS